MKKILILGGAGFIGLNLAKVLTTDSSNNVTIVDNFFRGKMDSVLSELMTRKNIKVVEADLTSIVEYEKFSQSYDEVYLLASMVGVEYVEKIPHEIIRVNSAIILNTAEWMKKSGSKKVLFTSTSECYAGAIDQFNFDVPTAENVPLVISDVKSPRFTYAITKMLGESTFIHYGKSYGFEVTIVRYHNVYGPRMGFKHVIPQMVKRFLDKQDPFLIYGAEQTRSFNYIDDAVSGTILAMNSNNTNQEIFHIGDSREEITISELAHFIGEQLGYEGKFEAAQNHAGSVNRRCPNVEKAKNVLGYVPTVNWKTGVAETIKWYKSYYDNKQEVFE